MRSEDVEVEEEEERRGTCQMLPCEMNLLNGRFKL